MVVSASHKHQPATLDKTRLRVEDNGVQAEVLSVAPAEELPVRLVILLDASNSTRALKLAGLKKLPEILGRVLRPGKDEVAFASFDTTLEPSTPFTDQPSRLAEPISAVRPGGATALYDSLKWACVTKMFEGKKSGRYRKAVLVISDGEDNQSRTSKEQALQAAFAAGISIHSVALVPGQASRGTSILEYFSLATGGILLTTSGNGALTRLEPALAEYLRAQQVITYLPQKLVADGSAHRVKITSSDPGVKILYDQYYFAPRQ
jgi:VWFA-related protein